jgi:hypothetical protein
MAITILQTPNQYEPAFQNTIPFVVESDLATESNFRYVFETYTGDTFATVNNFQSFNSAYPRFTDECVYSPHLILQSVVDYNLNPFITKFEPCTQSYQFYRIDFGEQYNPNLPFVNTFPDLNVTPNELFLIFSGTISTLQVGDQIRIDKTDKSINPQYDGYTEVTGGPFYLLGFTFYSVDTIYGTAPSFGTFSFPETGVINDLLRIATSSSTFSTFNGVRQYDEIDFDFEETYGIDIDYVDFIQNGDFDSNEFWTITNQLGGTASIGGGVLNYFDNAGGNGTSLVVQDGVLEVGREYRVTISVNNNNFVLIQVGDQSNLYTIATNANGTFTLTFTAAGDDFYLVLNSNGGVTQGVDVDFVKVESQFATQNKFLSVYKENTIKPTYLTNYETLSFMIDPNYPNFAYFGLPIINLKKELYDPQGNLVNEEQIYIGTDDDNLNGDPDYFDYSFGTPRFDVAVGPLNSTSDFFTSSIDCDGWKYKAYLQGPDFDNVILNPEFSTTASWIIATAGGADCFIDLIENELDFEQSVFGSTGSALVEQSNVFTPGLTYAIVIDVVNNLNTSITVGDSDSQVLSVINNETGVDIVFPFVPTSSTFSMNINGNDVFNFGVEIASVYVVLFGLTASRISEIKEYEILCQCREYDLVQLAFVNKLGGVDYWTFNLVSKFRSDITRDQIKKTLPYNYAVGNRQHKIINQKITETWQINTDWISDDQALFIRELIESPEVYWIKNGKLYPIIIRDDRYEFKSSLNDMQVQYTINFMMAFDILSNV